MDKEEQERFLASLKETQQKSKRTLERIQQTLNGVNTTLEDIKQTNQNIDKVKNQFSSMMDKLSIKISSSFTSPIKKSIGVEYEHIPTKITMEQAVEKMMKHEKILFITGAGVSVESGIPTFRGQNGLYTKKFQFQGAQLEPETFISKLFFAKHPEPLWEWIQSIYQLSIKSKPNEVHKLIDACALALSEKKKHITLVTQNIDDLHMKPEKNIYQYYPVHGNVKYMHCKNNHRQLYSWQKRYEKCQQCGQAFRPHVMFFDETYGVPFGGEVKDEKFPFVIVIGSSLNTGLCVKLAGLAEEVIEINPEPVIQIGKVYPFSDDTVLTLKLMIQAVKEFKQ